MKVPFPRDLKIVFLCIVLYYIYMCVCNKRTAVCMRATSTGVSAMVTGLVHSQAERGIQAAGRVGRCTERVYSRSTAGGLQVVQHADFFPCLLHMFERLLHPILNVWCYTDVIETRCRALITLGSIVDTIDSSSCSSLPSRELYIYIYSVH